MKKLLVLTLVLLCIVSLICSCGNNTDDTSSNDTQSNIDSTVDSDTSSDKQENTDTEHITDTNTDTTIKASGSFIEIEVYRLNSTGIRGKIVRLILMSFLRLNESAIFDPVSS